MKILPVKALRRREVKPSRALRRATTAARRRRREIDVSGIKLWFIPGSEFEGEGVMTPYANKEKRRRRAARRVAHESRRVNAQGRK